MNQNLEILIGKLQQVNPDIDALEVADMLWLSQYVFLDKKTETISDVDNHNELEDEHKETIDEDRDNRVNSDQKIDDNKETIEEIKEDSNDFSFDKQRDTSNSIKLKERKKERFFDLKIARQLKPLKRKISSHSEMLLDIDKTVDFIAQTGVYQAILEPKESKEFSLSIIVDQGLSMFLWEEPIADFKKSILSYGIFDKINFYYLATDEQKVKLFGDKNQTLLKSHKIAELNHRKNITFILSDCVSLAWRSNSVYDDFINFWTKHSFVAIVQMLPKRMWKRTPLNRGYQVNFKTNSFETPLNSSLDIDLGFVKKRINNETLKIPIILFDNYSFEYISKIITAIPNVWINGVALNNFKFKEFLEDDKEENMTAQQRVEYFFSVASPEAQNLAIYCSVLPLSIGIIKEVQKIKNLKQDITYIAEFYFGKLLKKSEILGEFDFHDGVRELLRVNLNATDAFELSEGLSDFIKEDLGTSIGFNDLLYSNVGEKPLSNKDRKLVSIFLDTFRRKGGRYLNKYKEITQNIEKIDTYKQVSFDLDVKVEKVIDINTSKPFKLLFLYRGNNQLAYQDKIISTIQKSFIEQNWHVDIRLLNNNYSFEEHLNRYKNVDIHDCLFYYIGDVEINQQEELFLKSDNLKVSFIERLKKIYTTFNNSNIAGIIDTCISSNIRLNNINDDIELLIFNSSEQKKSYQYEFSYYFCEAMRDSIDIITLPYIRVYLNSKQNLGGYVLNSYSKKDFTKNMIIVDKTQSEKTLFKFKKEIENKVYNEITLKEIPKAFIALDRIDGLVIYLQDIIDYFIKHINKKRNLIITNRIDFSKDELLKLIINSILILPEKIATENFSEKFVEQLFNYAYSQINGIYDNRPILFSFQYISLLLPKYNDWLFLYLKKFNGNHFTLDGYFKSMASSMQDMKNKSVKIEIFIEIIETLIKTELKINELPLWIPDFLEKIKFSSLANDRYFNENESKYYRLNYNKINGELTIKEALDEDKLKKDIFISYASEDKKEIIEPLVQLLEENEISYWYDKKDIAFGDNIVDQFNEGLEKSKYVMLVISKNFLEKEWTQIELHTILYRQISSGEKKVLPLVVGDIQPYELPFLLQNRKYIKWGHQQEIVDELKKILVQKIDNFIVEVFNSLEENRLVTILSQDITDITDYQDEIKRVAKTNFEDGFYYIEIPTMIEEEAIFFQKISESFDFHKQVKSANQFHKMMSLKLKESKKILLVVAGIEESNEILMRKFSMIIRSLRDFSNFYIILMGRKSLAHLIYANSSLSPLNTAVEIFFPNSQIDLDREYIISILSSLKEHRETICELMKRENLGRFTPWSLNEVINELFWKNLLINKDGFFAWNNNVLYIANEIIPCKNNLYQLHMGVENKLQFFGRKNLIQTLLYAEHNYIIIGARTLGKSSILKELKRQYSNLKNIECIYFSLIGKSILFPLADSLNLSKSFTLNNIIQTILEHDKKFVFLIEEVEEFIKLDKENNYEIINAFRKLSEEGKAIFIFTGFIELYKEITFNYQSPLKNFAKVIKLRGLEDSACRDLMIEPMKRIGVSYENDNLVTDVIKQCGNHPYYITYICHIILKQLDGRNIIKREDINNAIENFKYNKLNYQSIYFGDDDLSKSLIKIIISLTIKKENFTLKEIVAFLKNKGIDIESFEIEKTLNIMVATYTLNKNNTIYSYAVPLMKEMLLEAYDTLLIDVEVRKLKKYLQ